MWPELVAVSLLVLLEGQSCLGFSCPDNRACYCLEEGPGEYRVQCSVGNDGSGTAFDIQAIQSQKRLVLECVNSPDWADFAHMGPGFELGRIKSLTMTSCAPPGPEHAPELAKLLGLDELEFLKFVILNGTLSRQDLTPFPQLRTLVLSSNDLSNVTEDLFRDVHSLKQLELRNTNVRLTTGLLSGLSSLEILELGSNGLSEIQPGSFDGLNNLRLLNLWKNEFRTLEPGLLRNLRQLSRLDLNQNALTTLHPDIFEDLESLEVVNLNSNNFTSLPSTLFRTSPKLKSVKLMYNKQNLTELPNGLFSNLPNLESVMITRNGLQRLPEDLFWNSTGLKNLTLDRNYLTTLPQRIFQNTTELYTLSLSFNDLKELPDYVFEATTKLISIDLSKNHLTAINEKTLVGLESLKTLNLENNDLSYIHVNAFSYLSNLRVAKFANNKLTLRTGIYDIFGHISPFHPCHSLEELYLAHNNVTEMHSDWLVSLTRLRELDLKHNSFNYLQTEDLQFISSNVNVNLSHNNISRIVLARLEAISMMQNSSRDVRIDINHNPIRCDCEVYEFLRYINGDMHPSVQSYVHFISGELNCASPEYMLGSQVWGLKARSLTCLIESEQHRPGDPCSPDDGYCSCWFRPEDKALLLDCADRNLSRAPEWIDAKAPIAKVELDLRLNELTEPPSMFKKGYDKVTSLNLANNQITFIDERLLSPNLRNLILEGNNLTSIDSKILKRLSNSSRISRLTLHDNPWRCDCESRDLLSFVQSNYLDIPDLLKVTCASNNVSLSRQSVDEICPSSNHLIVLAACLFSVFALLLGAGVALYFGYQRQIKIWLFAKNLCLCLVTEEEVDKDKKYDAFISFSHKDEDFVVKELVAKLEEGPKPYKLCIHIRDWLVGEWIPNQIERSVDESRRTIVVLSANFIESVWSRFEFQAAHKQALKDNRARVIVVLYGEIGPIDKLDPDLKAYLQMNTYVKWGDPWFWQKLRYALPHSVKRAKDDSGALSSLASIAASKQIALVQPRQQDEKLIALAEAVKKMDKTLHSVRFDIRTPQCTTV
ncbi:hypothetical protein QAD02_016218 [Eretmocerus hayati]|uniref:Uncharacterized protein n=1 Tax=Eretmocerus hayati TaxID=131215 RepID=A0ACC2PBR5_9HYME|nr:hypothetical protein QAD02_016218 [Eretmocerus hayati]